jgi:hypothetical protein
VLGVSAVSVFESIVHRRDAEVAENYAEKNGKLRHYPSFTAFRVPTSVGFFVA